MEYNEKNHPGRDKCDQLREIREALARANNIDFEPAECHHTGPCMGTCPVCDAEVKYIDEELQKKKLRGEKVFYVGVEEEIFGEAKHDNFIEPEELVDGGREVLMGDVVYEPEDDERHNGDDDELIVDGGLDFPIMGKPRVDVPETDDLW